MKVARLDARPDVRDEPSPQRPLHHWHCHASAIGIPVPRKILRVRLHVAAFLGLSREHRSRKTQRRRRGWNSGRATRAEDRQFLNRSLAVLIAIPAIHSTMRHYRALSVIGRGVHRRARPPCLESEIAFILPVVGSLAISTAAGRLASWIANGYPEALICTPAARESPIFACLSAVSGAHFRHLPLANDVAATPSLPSLTDTGGRCYISACGIARWSASGQAGRLAFQLTDRISRSRLFRTEGSSSTTATNSVRLARLRHSVLLPGISEE